MSGELFGLSLSAVRDLREVFARTPGVERVWIFGSRARGDQREHSDIDLAVDAPGLEREGFRALLGRLDHLATLYKIDAVQWQQASAGEFRAEIERDRKVFWEPARRMSDEVRSSPCSAASYRRSR